MQAVTFVTDLVKATQSIDTYQVDWKVPGISFSKFLVSFMIVFFPQERAKRKKSEINCKKYYGPLTVTLRSS